jgi:hypothetical protein
LVVFSGAGQLYISAIPLEILTVSIGASTTDCGAPSIGLRIAQDGRFPKGDFRGGVAASGVSWTAGTLRLSMLGFGRPRAGEVERKRKGGHIIYKRTQLASTILSNLCDKLTSSEGSIIRSTTGGITRGTPGRARERISVNDGSLSLLSANASSPSGL